MYIAEDGQVYNITGTTTPAPCDEFPFQSINGPNFSEDEWTRFTIEDTQDWKAENQKWEGREKQWWGPFNWANYSD